MNGVQLMLFPLGIGKGESDSRNSSDDSGGDGDPILLVVRCTGFGARALTEHDSAAGRSQRLARQ